MDRIDIVMATYNGENYLKEMLDSIARQTYNNWNLIIRDDASTDKTTEIIKEFQKEHPNKVKLFINSPASGCARNNFFRLFHDVESEYIMCCDQDDYWVPEKIEVTYNKIKEIENGNKDKPLLVHSDLYVVDQDMKELSKSFFEYTILPKKINGLNEILIQNSITGCTMMFNQKMNELLCRDYNMDKILMHDWLAGMIASSFGEIAFVNQPTIKYRQHTANSVGAKNTKSVGYIFKQLKKGRKAVKEAIFNTTVQAEEFLRVFDQELSKKDKEMLSTYAKLYKGNKIKRLTIFNKYKIKKYGSLRRIGQYIWG